MKISCQSCQAKYTIADEKVLGKIVKIRCKKCGATIVINGNDSEATQANTAQTEDYTASNEQWTVNVAEGDQRTLTQAEIVAEYKSGVVNDETFCWKDGMNDWLPIREVEGLYTACTQGPGPALHTAGEFAPMSVNDAHHQQHAASAGAGDDEFPTQVGGAQDFSLFGGGGGAAVDTNGNGASLFGAAQPARRHSSPAPGASAGSAARRTGGRGNQGADLFGNVSQAGGEDDVMTSAPQGGGRAAPVADEKLTGQRNENSVLFSLNALTQTAPKDTSGAPVADGSGLIDIKALSASMGSEAPKSQRHVDDIMNLGGGGAFSAALAAPILAPPTHHDDYTSGGTPTRGKNMLLYVIIGGCVIMAMAMIIVALIVTGGSKKEADTTSPTGSVASAAPTDSAAMNTAPTTSVTAPIASIAAPTGPVAKAPNVGGGQVASNSGGSGKAHPSGGGDTTPPPAADPPKAATPPSLAQAMAQAAPGAAAAPPPAATGGTSPFDRGAAAAALGGVNVATCKKPDGPSGSGHVKVTFAPSGNVSTAEVDSPPFAGTGVGGCIAGKFRAAHIPAFAGGPVTVGKSFSLN